MEIQIASLSDPSLQSTRRPFLLKQERQQIISEMPLVFMNQACQENGKAADLEAKPEMISITQIDLWKHLSELNELIFQLIPKPAQEPTEDYGLKYRGLQIKFDHNDTTSEEVRTLRVNDKWSEPTLNYRSTAPCLKVSLTEANQEASKELVVKLIMLEKLEDGQPTGKFVYPMLLFRNIFGCTLFTDCGGHGFHLRGLTTNQEGQSKVTFDADRNAIALPASKQFENYSEHQLMPTSGTHGSNLLEQVISRSGDKAYFQTIEILQKAIEVLPEANNANEQNQITHKLLP